MKKVVINTCFGGFNLSPFALKQYFELTNPDKNFYTYYEKFDKNLPWPISQFILINDNNDIINDFGDIFFSEKNIGDNFYFVSTKEEAIYKEKHVLKELNEKGFTKEKIHKIIEDYCKLDFGEIKNIYACDIKRDDPILIQVIEEIGIDLAGGPFSELAIEEIPDNEEFYLEEYDGIETIKFLKK